MLFRLKQNIDGLVDEMLDKLPEEVWINNDTTFLDPVVAGGQFVKNIEDRLRKYGHSDDNISKRVYGFSDSPMSIVYAVNKNDLIGTYKVKNFLEDNIRMKFDVIVGNPPYQDSDNSAKNYKLWSKISLKVLELSPKYISFVTPDSIFRDIDSNGKKVRQEMVKNGYSVVNFVRHGRGVFNVGVDTSHWSLVKDGRCIVDEYVFNDLNDVEISICDKVIGWKNKLPLEINNLSISRGDILEDGDNEILFSGDKVSKTDKKVDGEDELKIVIPFSSSYKKTFMTTKACGMLNKCMKVSKDEGEFILKYIQSPLFKFVANRYKKTSGFTPFVKNNMIPDLRGEDISDLYGLFKIDQSEIDYINLTTDSK